MFRKIVATSSYWFTVPIRLTLGAVMIGHGAQKVLGSFSGPGYEKFVSGTTPFACKSAIHFPSGNRAVSRMKIHDLDIIEVGTRERLIFLLRLHGFSEEEIQQAEQQLGKASQARSPAPMAAVQMKLITEVPSGCCRHRTGYRERARPSPPRRP